LTGSYPGNNINFTSTQIPYFETKRTQFLISKL